LNTKYFIVVLFPNAKINIGLRIISKRQDGYHNLETIFYPVNWCDVLEIVPAESRTEFIQTGLAIEGGQENNLCLRAYALMKEYSRLPDIRIFLHKIIPMGAGLGGGSSDGAAVLKLLNALFGLHISNGVLLKMALKLGSDCPFFIYNKPVFAQGRGEEISETGLSLKGYHILIIKPPVHISTADAFRMVRTVQHAENLNDLVMKPVEEWKEEVINDFEKPVFSEFPLLKSVKEDIYRQGALYASMSGSGSALYGIFDKRPECKALPEGWQSWCGMLE
jgi:4-diphosphocytidyl-2-C-methyl-D-erythritol kinase